MLGGFYWWQRWDKNPCHHNNWWNDGWDGFPYNDALHTLCSWNVTSAWLAVFGRGSLSLELMAASSLSSLATIASISPSKLSDSTSPVAPAGMGNRRLQIVSIALRFNLLDSMVLPIKNKQWNLSIVASQGKQIWGLYRQKAVLDRVLNHIFAGITFSSH